MSVTLEIDATGEYVSLPYSGFARMRQRVAALHNAELGELYSDILGVLARVEPERRGEEWRKMDERLNTLVKSRYVKAGVADFCFQPDALGYLTYRDCKTVLGLLKMNEPLPEEDFGFSGGWPFTLSDFRDMLEVAVENRSRISWY